MKNAKGIIIFTIFVIALLAGLVWLGQRTSNGQPANNQSNGGVLAAVEQNFDFGTISMAAGKVSHTFAIKNTGTNEVVINKMYTSCMCTEATLVKSGKKLGPFGMPGHGFIPNINEAISPGGEARVEVVFDPAAHGPAGIGRIQRTVIIENNSGRPLEFGFTAMVTP